jgi:hypothetical protein
MQFIPRSALVLLSSLALACSSGKDGSQVSPGDGGKGAADGGGNGATGAGGSPGSTAGGLNLGGRVSLDEAGNHSGGDDATSMPDLPSDVNVIITADNAYGFGYGTKTELANYFGGVENVESGDIFDCPVGHGPEQYVVPAADANTGGFLYIIGYADKLVTQGVIAKFYRDGGMPVYTGSGKWEACATGEDYDPGSGGPSLSTINDYIAKCNAGSLDPATSSVGWVGTTESANGRLAFGEDNSTTRDGPTPGNEFLIACEIEPSARWMWFDWEPKRTDGSPFMWPGGATNVTKDFLIFRLGADQIPKKPPK